MATKKYSIYQLTEADVTKANRVTKKIPIPQLTIDGGNAVITTTPTEVEYATIVSNKNIVKLGYICEPKGIRYPLFIKQDNDTNYTKVVLGKEGIYEAQSTDNQIISINSVQVPVGINFKLDLVVPFENI